MTSPEGLDFRVGLVRLVEQAVDREAFYMQLSPEIGLRTKEALILRMLARFSTKESIEGIEAIRPYLRKCAQRELAKEVDREARKPKLTLLQDLEERVLAPASDDPQTRAEERHEFVHLMTKVKKGLEVLSDQERRIVKMRMDGFRDQAIAAVLGTSVDTVYVQASQAIQKLRKLYHEQD